MRNLSQKTKFEIIRQIKDGYENLFKNDLIHRDIKPDNIFIYREKPLRVMLGDFGSIQDKGMCNTIVGTRLF